MVIKWTVCLEGTLNSALQFIQDVVSSIPRHKTVFVSLNPQMQSKCVGEGLLRVLVGVVVICAEEEPCVKRRWYSRLFMCKMCLCVVAVQQLWKAGDLFVLDYSIFVCVFVTASQREWCECAGGVDLHPPKMEPGG